MAEHNDLGKKGEELALEFLKEEGFTILETNWRSGKHEIDIIASDGHVIVIAEVKTQKSNKFGEPESFVNKNKQRMIIQAANHYILSKRIMMEARFDIISITEQKGKLVIEHIPDAFYPTIY